jgi:NDP-sugar pyrophosphorylase family protein
MDAILLAAGFGTRLRPHTLTTPKPLLPIQGRPILDWTMGSLPEEISRVVVVVHYLGEQIEKYMQQQKWIKDFKIVRQDPPKGTGDALRSCKPFVKTSSFLVLNGDDLYGSQDLKKLAATSAGVIVKEVNDPWNFGVASYNSNGSLEKMTEKPKIEGPAMANTGAYHFPQSVFTQELEISSRGEYEITDYLSTLAKQQRVEVIPAGFWYPVGTVEALELVQKIDLSAMTR